MASEESKKGPPYRDIDSAEIRKNCPVSRLLDNAGLPSERLANVLGVGTGIVS